MAFIGYTHDENGKKGKRTMDIYHLKFSFLNGDDFFEGMALIPTDDMIIHPHVAVIETGQRAFTEHMKPVMDVTIRDITFERDDIIATGAASMYLVHIPSSLENDEWACETSPFFALLFAYGQTEAIAPYRGKLEGPIEL